MTPRVSVLLTCYNHLAYLPEALAGVRAQTFGDYEVIALDDGSSDGTREWLAEQEGIEVVLNERNLGTYGTLNEGLRRARGEFVAVLNDDDVWRSEKLARQIELLDARPEVALVHTGGWFLNGVGERTEGNPLGFAWPTFPTDARGWWSGDALLALVPENKVIASAALARTAVLRDLGGFDEGYFGSGDWDMWWRVALRHDLGFVAEELTGYRVHGANASHKLERIWRDDERLREKLDHDLRHLSAWGRVSPEDPGLPGALAHNLAALGTVRMLNGKPAAARAAYARSIAETPLRWKSYARWALTLAGPDAFRRLL